MISEFALQIEPLSKNNEPPTAGLEAVTRQAPLFKNKVPDTLPVAVADNNKLLPEVVTIESGTPIVSVQPAFINKSSVAVASPFIVIVPVPVDGLNSVRLAPFLKINCPKFVLPQVAVTAPVVGVAPPTFAPSIIRTSAGSTTVLLVPEPFNAVFHFGLEAEVDVKLTLLVAPVPPIQ